MGLIDFIEKLRQKPRYIRVQIMWLVVVFCMAVIFFGWIWSLTDLNKEIAGQSGREKIDSSGWEQFKKDIPSLWSSLGAGLSNTVSSIEDMLQSEGAIEEIMPSPTIVFEPQRLPIE